MNCKGNDKKIKINKTPVTTKKEVLANIRDRWWYQNGWIFGKVPKRGWGGGHFQSNKLYCRFWTFLQVFKQHFFIKNATWFFEIEGGGVKGCLELFQRFIRFGSVTRPWARLRKIIRTDVILQCCSNSAGLVLVDLAVLVSFVCCFSCYQEMIALIANVLFPLSCYKLILI